MGFCYDSLKSIRETKTKRRKNCVANSIGDGRKTKKKWQNVDGKMVFGWGVGGVDERDKCLNKPRN